MQGLEAALDRTGSDCRPGPHRSGETLETVRAKVFKTEFASDGSLQPHARNSRTLERTTRGLNGLAK